MPQTKRSVLAVRKSRLALPVAKKPFFESLGDGVSVGYRKNQGAGTWVARKSDGRGGSNQRVIGQADDYQEADGEMVLSWTQAQAKTLGLAHLLGASGDGETRGGSSLTVRDAIEQYRRDLVRRGGDTANVERLKRLPQRLADRIVPELRRGELRAWRDGLLRELKPASVNRTCSALRAALNLATQRWEDIGNPQVWESDLAALPDASEARNTILPDELVRRIVAAAYSVEEAFGLLVEAAAVTGARYGQLTRLRVQDLQEGDATPRLMMPSSLKGRGRKQIRHRPVPIPPSLASRLRSASDGREGDRSLLTRANGAPWKRSEQTRPFKLAVRSLALDEDFGRDGKRDEITMYALRHSSIARQLLRGVPIRVVAINHDTSVAMIERNYSALLADHSDQIARNALIDLGI